MEHGPYNGYLAQVTVDYFTQTPPDAEQQHGLRDTHDAVFEGMSPELRQAVAPYMNDIVPWPPLLGELKRATFGAWGNYVGDQYELARRGEIPATEDRREMAVRSTLTMGFLSVTEAALGDRDPARSTDEVAGFFAKVTHSLMTGEVDATAILPEVDADVRASHETVAQHLAAFMYRRFGLREHHRLRITLGSDMDKLAALTETQLTTPPTDEATFLDVARGLGTTSAALVLRHAQMRYRARETDDLDETVAFDLGALGGYLRHGTNIVGTLRAHLPTYATAILAKHGGATKAALAEIRALRNEKAGESERYLKELDVLDRSSARRRGIVTMARHLLWIKEGFLRRRGTARQINQVLRTDPFWQEWMASATPEEA